MAGPELTDLQERGTLFRGFAGIWPNTATLTGDGDPEQLRIGFVTMIAMSVIAFAGLLASWFPARKASVSNPSEVMRAD